MNEKTNEKRKSFLEKLFKFFFVDIILFILIMIGIQILIDLFKSPGNVSVVYYCFGILAAITSICFTFSRSFDTNSPEHLFLRNIGGKMLMATLFFLVASMFTFFRMSIDANNVIIDFTKNEGLDKPIPLRYQSGGYKILYWSMKIITLPIFSFGFYYATVGLHSLLNFLFEKNFN